MCGCVYFPPCLILAYFPPVLLTILTSVPHLFSNSSPPTNFFYENTTTFHHKWDYRSRRTHLTKEGISQGCPLSPLFASLVVAHLLEPIDSRHSFTNELQRNSPLAIQVMMDLVASHTYLAMLMTFPHVSTSTTYHFSAQHSKPPALLSAAS